MSTQPPWRSRFRDPHLTIPDPPLSCESMRAQTGALRVVVLVSMLLSGLRLSASDNLIVNDGFESDELGYLAMWSTEAYQNDAESVRFFATEEQKRTGARSFAIANLKPNDARALQWVRVEPDTYYRLSCWIMASGIGTEGVGANISVLGSTSAAGGLTDTKGQWQLVELWGKTGPEQHALGVMVRLGFYGNLATGIAIFDDVILQKMDAPPGGDTPVISFSSNASGGTLPVVRGAVASQAPPGFVSRGLFNAALALLAVAFAAAAGFLWRSSTWRQLALRGGSAAARVSSHADGGLEDIAGGGATSLDRQRLRGKPAIQAPRAIEHRSSQRKPVTAEVSVRKKGRDGKVTILRLLTRDISDGGLFVLSDDLSILELDQEVSLDATVGGKAVALGKAIVMRAQERFDKKGQPAGGGFGLMFTDFSAKMAKARRLLAAAATGGQQTP